MFIEGVELSFVAPFFFNIFIFNLAKVNGRPSSFSYHGTFLQPPLVHNYFIRGFI